MRAADGDDASESGVTEGINKGKRKASAAGSAKVCPRFYIVSANKRDKRQRWESITLMLKIKHCQIFVNMFE